MNILITRPDERGAELVQLLEAQQIFALHQPIFRFEAGRDLSQLPTLFSRLNVGDYVFVVSKQAVEFAVRSLGVAGFPFRSDLVYFAVGKKTAEYLSEQSGVAVHYPLQNENSEGLLDLAQMQQLADKNILILRADSGREYFAQEALNRGAVVQYAECYRRVLLEMDFVEQISLYQRLGIDTLVITSGEILRAFFSQVQENDKHWLMSCRLVVVSRRIAELAEQFGWSHEQISVTQGADNRAILETLLSFKAN